MNERVFEMVTSDGHTFRIRALTRVQLDNAIEAHGWYPAAPLAASLWAHEGQPAAYYSLAGRGQEVKV